MKSLVTGGAGFLGAHVSEYLIKMGHEVVVIDDLSGGFKENLPVGCRFLEMDIVDTESINTLFEEEKFDYVFHLAAYAAEGLSSFIKKFNYENNLIGSVNLINASINHDIKCFVFTSSIAVYGTSDVLPVVEDFPYNPEDSYGIAKMAVELELKSSKEFFDLDYIIFRPHNVYGEKQNIGDAYRNVVGIFMNQILSKKALTIFGNGEQTRAFTYISDVAPIIARSINNPLAYNEIFNIGSDIPHTVNELAEGVSVAMGVEENIVYLPARHEVVHVHASHEKLQEAFDSAIPITLKEGLSRTARWVKRFGAKESKKFDGVEVTKNFPKAWEKYLK